MSKQLRFSRWRRLPGLHRVSEKKLPTYLTEAQRLTLFVPGAVLDQAEKLAAYAGTCNLQAYCEQLFSRAVAEEADRVMSRGAAAAADAMKTVDVMTQEDEPTLREWNALTTLVIDEHGRASEVVVREPDAPTQGSGPESGQ
jgi:hypothetical protein